MSRWCQWIINCLDANVSNQASLPRDSTTTLQQMRRFCAVGMGLNALLFVAFLVLVDAGAGPKVAMTAIYVSGVALGFVLHRKWSFVSRSAATQEGVAYGVVCLGGYLLNFLVLWLCVDRLGWAHGWVQGAMILIVAVLSFAFNKFWVFRASN